MDIRRAELLDGKTAAPIIDKYSYCAYLHCKIASKKYKYEIL